MKVILKLFIFGILMTIFIFIQYVPLKSYWLYGSLSYQQMHVAALQGMLQRLGYLTLSLLCLLSIYVLIQYLPQFFEKLGKKVLLIDLDPQGNLSSSFGIDIDNLETTAYNAMKERNAEPYIIKISENLHILPSNLVLERANIEFSVLVQKCFLCNLRLD